VSKTTLALAAALTVLTSPGNCVGHILLSDAKLGEFVAHLIQAAALQRLERDRGAVRTDVEVLHSTERVTIAFGRVS